MLYLLSNQNSSMQTDNFEIAIISQSFDKVSSTFLVFVLQYLDNSNLTNLKQNKKWK